LVTILNSGKDLLKLVCLGFEFLDGFKLVFKGTLRGRKLLVGICKLFLKHLTDHVDWV